MGFGMAISMTAIMALSATPFFLAYGRDTRRAAATATIVLIYLTVWAGIGLALDHLMRQVMLPALSLAGFAFAVAVALLYGVTPWGRWAREECRRMSTRGPRGPRLGDAVADAASYTACCVVCSAGVMLVVIVLGMSNPLVIVGGAAVLLGYKLVAWPSLAFSGSR